MERLLQKSLLKPIGIALLGFSFIVVQNGISQDEVEYPTVKISGYTQATAERVEKLDTGKKNDGIEFGFDRVRMTAKGGLNKIVDYKLQVDFTETADDVATEGSTPGNIRDAYLTAKTGFEGIGVAVGKFKIPIGMEFNRSASELDFVKRSFSQDNLVFGRNVGAMVHGSGYSELGVGFAAGIFNPGPNNALGTGTSQKGDYTVAGRITIDPDEKLHGQVYLGSALTSLPDATGQSNINILGVGVRAHVTEKLTLRGEYLTRDDDQGPADGISYYGQAAYRLNKNIEPTFKYEELDVNKEDRGGAGRSDDFVNRTDTTFGLNFYLNPDHIHQSKIMINYVSSHIDGNDAFQVLFQGSF